jgi:hypothetical protein
MAQAVRQRTEAPKILAVPSRISYRPTANQRFIYGASGATTHGEAK